MNNEIDYKKNRAVLDRATNSFQALVDAIAACSGIESYKKWQDRLDFFCGPGARKVYATTVGGKQTPSASGAQFMRAWKMAFPPAGGSDNEQAIDYIKRAIRVLEKAAAQRQPIQTVQLAQFETLLLSLPTAD